jgi:hypothetical protein
MTAFTSDEIYERLLRSLQQNSAYCAERLRAERTARLRSIVEMCVLFASGVAVGALLIRIL